MKKVPKAIGLGFGIALSSGAMLSPAEAQQTHTETIQTSEQHLERTNPGSDYFYALGFLAMSAVVTVSAGRKLGKALHEKFWDTESDPYLLSEKLHDTPLPKFTAMTDDLDAISRAYYEAQQMTEIELDAEWIAYHAARTKEL